MNCVGVSESGEEEKRYLGLAVAFICGNAAKQSIDMRLCAPRPLLLRKRAVSPEISLVDA